MQNQKMYNTCNSAKPLALTTLKLQKFATDVDYE